MQKTALTILRDGTSSITAFRAAVRLLAQELAHETIARLPQTTVPITTPINNTFGTCFDYPILLVPILRSGIALLPTFLDYFNTARVGFLGLQRAHQNTLKQYFTQVPTCTKQEYVIILDPIIATGASMIHAVRTIQDQGVPQENIRTVSIIACQSGIDALKKYIPEEQTITAAIDPMLTSDHFVSPGLGDFGERYFGV